MNTPHASIDDLEKLFTPLYSYQLPVWWKTTEGILLITGAALIITGLLCAAAWYRWWYKPPLTLEQWAARELDALGILLEKRPLNYKRFFGAVTFFFKQYLVRLYSWNVLNKTDDELWEFLKEKSEIPGKLHHPIQELLSYAQIIKFADAHALGEKAEEAQEYLKLIIKTLKKNEPK